MKEPSLSYPEKQGLKAQHVINGLFHSVKDGLLIYFDEDYHKGFVNDSFCHLFGYTCEIFMTGENMGVIPPGLVGKIRQELPDLFQFIRGAEHESRSIVLQKNNEEKVHVLLDRSSYTCEDGLLHIFILRDITWLAFLEKRKKDAEHFLRHDIRNFAIEFGNLGNLLAMESLSQEKIREFAGHMQERSARLLKMLDEDLDNFSLQNGAYKIAYNNCNINHILTSISAQFNLVSDEPRLVLAYEHGPNRNPGVDSHLYGDCLLLERMLHNLIKNAIEASPSKDKIHILVHDLADEVLVEVHNMGAIPENLREGFMREKATSKEQGHGVGAYGARLIAEAHGGSIEFETDEERGTTLTVHLPRPDRETS